MTLANNRIKWLMLIGCFIFIMFAVTGCKIPEKQLILNIDSRPTGATIFVDGEEVGKTPTLITKPFMYGMDRVFSDPITVEAYLEGYEPPKKSWKPDYQDVKLGRPQHMLFILTPIKSAVTAPVTQPQMQQQQQMMGPTIVIGGKTVTGEEAVKIVNYGMAKFDSTPQGAEVMIEGNSVGFTPTAFLKFQAGTYNVKIIKTGYKPWERKIMIIQDSTITINPELEKK